MITSDLMQTRIDTHRAWTGKDPVFLPVTAGELKAFVEYMKDQPWWNFRPPDPPPPHQITFCGIPLREIPE